MKTSRGFSKWPASRAASSSTSPQVASDAGFPPRTVREHYQVLEDTLVGYELPAFQRTSKRKPVATAKLVFLELRSFLDYHRLDHELTYWRSRSRFEVDFVVGNQPGIEVHAKTRISPRDYRRPRHAFF